MSRKTTAENGEDLEEYRSFIEGSVEAILPDPSKGVELQLPPALHQNLKDITYRKESPSSVRNFLDCPLSWYMNRYAEFPGTPPPSQFGVMGSFVHRVLEVFYSELPEDRTPEQLERTIELSWSALTRGIESGIIPFGPYSLQSEFDNFEEHLRDDEGTTFFHLDDGELRPVEDRINFFRRWLKKWSKICLESIEDFDEYPEELDVVENEKWVRTTVNGVRFNGKIDRIVRTALGRDILDDYKTGAPPRDDEEVDVLAHSFIAMGMYAIMYQEVEPEARIHGVRLLFLKGRKKYFIKIRQEHLDKTLLLLERVTELMQDVIDTGKILAIPGVDNESGPCRYCPISGLCPAYSEELSWDETYQALGMEE